MRRTILCLLSLLLLLSIIPASYAENTDDELAERFRTSTIEYNGVTYRPRSRIETILLIGTDMREGADPANVFSSIQADFLMLLVVDDDQKIVTPVRINRDTMCSIHTQMISGGFRDGLGQIALAFSSASSLEQGCELTAYAVSGLFKGININHYYAMNMDGIAALNDAIGGVTVIIPEDMTYYDADMVQGETLKLTGEQAYHFLRARYHIGDESNVARMRRQKMYMDGAKLILVKKLHDDPNSFGDLYDQLQDYVTTDMAKGRIINLAAKAQRYEVADSVTPEGVNLIGAFDYVEFTPDEDSIMDILLKVFYEEV